MPFVVYAELLDELNTLYRHDALNKKKRNNYVVHQFMESVSKLHQKEQGRYFYDIQDVVDTVTRNFRQDYATTQLRKAIHNLFNKYDQTNGNNSYSRNNSYSNSRNNSNNSNSRNISRNHSRNRHSTSNNQDNQRERSRSRSRANQPLRPQQAYDKASDVLKKAYNCLAFRYQSWSDPDPNAKFLFTLKSLYDNLVLTHEIAIEPHKSHIKKQMTIVHQSISCVSRKYIVLPQWRTFLFRLKIEESEYQLIKKNIGKKNKKTKKENNEIEICFEDQELMHQEFIGQQTQPQREDDHKKEESCDILILSNSKCMVFEEKHWLLLFNYDPKLYNMRLEIKNDRVELLFAEKYGADVERSDPDGNCVPFCFLRSLGREITDTSLMEMRKILNNIASKNETPFQQRNVNNCDIYQYSDDKVLLAEDHFAAFSEKYNKILIIFEYDEKVDDFSMKIFSQPHYTECVFVLYSLVANTETDAGHIDNVVMPKTSFDINKFKLENGFTFIKTSKMKNENYCALKEFDEKYKVPQILDNYTELHQKFGIVLARKLIETKIFPIRHLMLMANKLNLSRQQFKDKALDESISNICEHMAHCNL